MNKIQLVGLLVPSVLILGFTTNVFAGAASITFDQYRIILDKNQQSAELTLRNTEPKNAECLLDLTHFNFSDTNQLLEVEGPDSTYMPANKLLRYSPRSVSIPGNTSQRVKISYRHRANLEVGEYLSFFQIGCSEKSENLIKGQPNIGAKVNYNLPVHVRIGEATATTSLEVYTITPVETGYRVVLKQTREGNRSLIGEVKFIEKSTGDILANIRNFSLYRPAKSAELTVTFNKKPSGGVVVEFAEKSNVYNSVTQTLEIPESRF